MYVLRMSDVNKKTTYLLMFNIRSVYLLWSSVNSKHTIYAAISGVANTTRVRKSLQLSLCIYTVQLDLFNGRSITARHKRYITSNKAKW